MYGATTGGKRAQEAAARAAMESRLKSKLIDTFGFLEELMGDHDALVDFHRFAMFGCFENVWCAESQHSLMSPYIMDYASLRPKVKAHIMMLLVSQQKLEAFFKDYRYGVNKRAGDDLKEAVFMTKQNVYKRSRAEDAAGMQNSTATYTKQDALDRLKERRAAMAEHSTTLTSITHEMAPHIGHGRYRRGRAPGASAEAAPAEGNKGPKGPNRCKTCKDPVRGHPRRRPTPTAKPKKYPCDFTVEELEVVAQQAAEEEE